MAVRLHRNQILSKFTEPEDKVMREVRKPAAVYLQDAIGIQENRAKEYDNGVTERSMASVVKAFNAIYGTELTETMGWQFMVLLKMRRQHTSPIHHEDSALDEVSYAALAAESSSAESKEE